ncbi:hypothetical protein JB92DRAFT_3143732 [Gautieria morchelliformis]|nr:hypothetical protein JB92DRAFT_3143732 [Gautieria morchelliformis]
MALDQFGKIAAAEIAFYSLLICLAFFTALRHGFGRREGWVFLFTFSLVRLVGAAITVASKASPSIGLAIAAAVLSGIGLTPLLLATQAFIARLAHYGLSSPQLVLRLIRALLVVAPILAIVGGTSSSPANSASSIATGRSLTRASVCLFMAAFVVLFGLHVMLWHARAYLQDHHHRLLAGVSLALPPLFVRLVYALLGAFAASPISRWSSIFGDWRIYLTMGLLMEFIAVVIYVATGILIPAHKDEDAVAKGDVQLGLLPVEPGDAVGRVTP